MVKTTVLKALTNYFNSNPENKKGLKEFKVELDLLSPEEKRELATLAAEAMGQTIDA